MRCKTGLASLLAIAVATPAAAQDASGLLFRVSADKSLTADTAAGDPVPNFRSGVSVVPDGAIGGAARWADDGYVAWKAPGNMRAQRLLAAARTAGRRALRDLPRGLCRS